MGLFLTNELMVFRRDQSEKRTRVYENTRARESERARARDRDEWTAGRETVRAGGRAHGSRTSLDVTDFPPMTAETRLWRGLLIRKETVCAVYVGLIHVKHLAVPLHSLFTITEPFIT